MDEMIAIARRCGVCFRCGRAANSVVGFIKTMWSVRKIAPLIVLLPLNVYAAAERFPDVQVQLDKLADETTFAGNPTAVISAPVLDAAVSFESPVRVPTPGRAEVIASAEGGSLYAEAAGGNPRDEVVSQTLASLDVVDTGILEQAQDLQPAQVVSRKTASLEVIDTGTKRQVQNPQPVEAVSAETESSSTVVTAAPGGTADDPAKNYEVMLPIAAVAGSTERVETAEVASGSAASEEIIHLPYAVLLAILALMSMIPVARRKG